MPIQVSAAQTPVICAHNFSKTFARRTVLRDVTLEILPGEIHALLGQNGSGKSTFIKILAGYHDPDPGAQLLVRGTNIPLPLDAGAVARQGLSFVHQDLGLYESGTVIENVCVGCYETGAFWKIPWRKERERIQESLARFGLSIDPNTKVSVLDEVDRVIVAIVRALAKIQKISHGLLVLDEATASLPRDGIDRLFRAIHHLTSQGHAVLFVTHRLEEVRAIADRVTILRDGRLVETKHMTGLDEQDLVSLILGTSAKEFYLGGHRDQAAALDSSPPILSVQGLAGSRVKDASFDLRQGEILGLTGLLGMGQEQVLYLLSGAERARAGTLRFQGIDHNLHAMTPNKASATGLSLLPANRLRDGAVGTYSVFENVTLPVIHRYFRQGRLRHRLEQRDVHHMLQQLAVRPPNPRQLFGTFSGGNQQKALVAKALITEPQVLLMHEPTHGVDVGAKQEIIHRICDIAQSGTSVIIATIEYEDLAVLCNRVLVFRDGRVVNTLQGNEISKDRIMAYCLQDDV